MSQNVTFVDVSIQEQLYQEHLRQHESVLQEAQKTSLNHAQAISKLEVLDKSKKEAETEYDKLKSELAQSKVSGSVSEI